jgi:hypothetical protein
MPISHVEAIVAALDNQDPPLCSRLDLHAFIIVYLILSRSEDCLAQQRGLALLTVRFLLDQSPSLIQGRSLCKGSLRLRRKNQTWGKRKRFDLVRRL